VTYGEIYEGICFGKDPNKSFTTSCEALMFYRILLTRNVKDFQRIPGLKLYRPG